MLLVSLTQVGVTYAANTETSTPVANRDYIFGLSKSSQVNLNQVLFLLAGKDGKDGRNGIDGINGTNGIDGTNGINGTNGTNGVDGKDGINGTNGKDGINGTNGKDGINGKDGKDGKDGAGANGSSLVNVILRGTGCTQQLEVALRARYTAGDFVFDSPELKNVDTACGGKTIYFWITIQAPSTGVSPKVPNIYADTNDIKCTYTIPASGTWGAAPNPQFILDANLSVCQNFTVPGANFRLKDISTRDHNPNFGIEFTN